MYSVLPYKKESREFTMRYGVSGCGGGDYFTSHLKVNKHNSSGSEWGQFGMMMLGNVFDMAALVGTAALSKGESGEPSAKQQAAAGLTATINDYVQADKEYDEAKKNINKALNEYKDLKGEYQKALDAQDPAKKADKQKEVNDFKQAGDSALGIRQYQKDLEAYDKAVADKGKYDQLGAEIKGLDTQAKELLNGGDLTPTGEAKPLDNHGGSFNISKATIDNGGPGGSQRVTGTETTPKDFEGKGADAAKVSQDDFQFAMKTGEKEYTVSEKGKTTKKKFPTYELKPDMASFNKALAKAKSNDSTFAAREAKAQQYKDLQAQIKQKQGEQDQLKNQNTGYDFTQSSSSWKKPQMPMGNVSVGGKSLNADQFLASEKNAQTELREMNDAGTKENVAELKAQLSAKKSDIKGNLATKLEAAKEKFEAAKEKFDKAQTAASSTQGGADLLANAKDAANSASSTKNNRQLYKSMKKEQRANAKAFNAAYGTTYMEALQKLKDGQEKVDKVKIADINMSTINGLT